MKCENQSGIDTTEFETHVLNILRSRSSVHNESSKLGIFRTELRRFLITNSTVDLLSFQAQFAMHIILEKLRVLQLEGQGQDDHPWDAAASQYAAVCILNLNPSRCNRALSRLQLPDRTAPVV